MNKKVFISMLILSISFLVGMYILKIFFPQEFMMSIQNERIIEIGSYIDNHKWLYYICCAIPPFITYCLYCSACSKRLWLKWYEYLFIVLVIILCRVINFYDINMANIISWCSFMFLPALMGSDIKTSAIVFTTHSIMQGLSINIRNLPMYLMNVNYLTSILMTFECYLWLVLFYIIFNYQNKKEK